MVGGIAIQQHGLNRIDDHERTYRPACENAEHQSPIADCVVSEVVLIVLPNPTVRILSSSLWKF